jgi:hypothetical protein
MAPSTSSSSSPAPAPALGQAVYEKLPRENYLLWKAQVLAAVHGARLSGFLDGTTPAPSATIQTELPDKTTKSKDNPAYAAWYAQGQLLLSFLLNSVTKEVLGQVATETSAVGMWRAILGMFTTQLQEHIVYLHSKLSSMCKGESPYAAYYA